MATVHSFALIMNKKGEAHDELEEKIYGWAFILLVSLFVCGTALAAGNDAFEDTPAQGKEENQVYRFGNRK